MAFGGTQEGNKDQADTNEALAAAFSDVMQDGKGVDDPPETTGRRRIIINSCSQAKDTGSRLGKWARSTIGGRRAFRTDSNAVSLTKTINDPRVDVYANEQEFSLRRTADRTGIYAHTSMGDRDIPMLKLNMSDRGKLQTTEVQTIQLQRGRVPVSY
jgi:hypothetical protein